MSFRFTSSCGEYFSDSITSVTWFTSLGYGAYDYGKAPAKKQKGLTLKLRFFLSLVLLIPEMYLAMGHMIGLPAPEGWLSYGLQIALTLAVLLINYRFFVSGVMAAVKLVPNMDTLVTLGAAASFFYSLAVAISGSGGHLFFESAAMIVTLVTLGKWLEARSKSRTGEEVEKLLRLAPDQVTVERGGSLRTVRLSEVVRGDVVVVRQGDSIPVDGVILSGQTSINQAVMTGESLPVDKGVGEDVFCGIGYTVVADASQASPDSVNLINIANPASEISPSAEFDYMIAAEPVVTAKTSDGALGVVGDLQALYGEGGYPQAVMIAKNSLIESDPEFIRALVDAVAEGAQKLASDGADIASIIEAVNANGGAGTLTAGNLKPETLKRCAIAFEAAADAKSDVLSFIEKYNAVTNMSLSLSDAFFYSGNR